MNTDQELERIETAIHRDITFPAREDDAFAKDALRDELRSLHQTMDRVAPWRVRADD